MTGMSLGSRLRRWLAGSLVLAILSLQIATAAYACPVESAQSILASTVAMAGMPCDGSMPAGTALDPEQPGLCLQHCLFGKTQIPSDNGQPQPASTEAAPLLVDSPITIPDLRYAGFIQHLRTRDRTPPPVHSIVHCCYRI